MIHWVQYNFCFMILITRFENRPDKTSTKLGVVLANTNSLQTTVVDEETPDQSERIAKLEALLKAAEMKIEVLQAGLHQQQNSDTLRHLMVNNSLDQVRITNHSIKNILFVDELTETQ
uniref:Uncharacterized protein n=1 Tax=Panagrellus redivivus TaxID=6233 RepID=A0A7E4ZW42_PANRE